MNIFIRKLATPVPKLSWHLILTKMSHL